MFFAKLNDISYVKQKQQLDNGCEFSDGVVICSFVLCPFFFAGEGLFLCISVFFYKIFLTLLQRKNQKKDTFLLFYTALSCIIIFIVKCKKNVQPQGLSAERQKL